MSNYQSDLETKISNQEAVIGVLGLGYVGLPLLLTFIESGFRVIGFDVDKDKISKLRNRSSYISHIPSSRIAALDAEKFQVTTSFELSAKADVLIICVPTPLNKNREPDLDYVVGTMESIAPHLRKGQLLSLESTTYPGTTEEELLPRLESRGFSIGEDFFLIYSPEREDPGNKNFKTSSIPKICGGQTPACLKLGRSLYEQIISEVIPVSSTQAAEMTKLLENIHRAVNIGLVNEMKILADEMNIDIHEVINAASTKPFGFTPFYPGPGLGGHCIPLDPFYLTWKAREYGLHTRFIELAGEVNQSMPRWVVGKIFDALNAQGKPIKNSKILIAGIAYKKNIEDLRESPSVDIMAILAQKGAQVAYSDPHVPRFPKTRGHSFELESINLSEDSIKDFDCIVIATDHDDFDYDLIKNYANLIVDTRGRYKTSARHIIKA